MARATAAQWLAAAHEARQTLRKRCDTVTVAGLSLGGLLALLLAEEGLADACVAISAPMATRNRWLRYAWLIAPFYPRVSWAPEADRHRDLNPAFDYGYSGFPTRNALDLARLIHKARKGLSRVQCPLLVVQSTGDQVVWPGSADWMMSHVSTEAPQRLTLQGVPHACTISAEMPRITAAIDSLEKSL
jgi:carboxylesterase